MGKNIEHILDTTRPELTNHERAFVWTKISSMLTPTQADFILSPFSRIIRAHRRVFALALIVILLVSGGATMVTAEAARPGDTLFPLDQAIEHVRIRLAQNDDARGRLASAFADERLGELRSIVDERRGSASSSDAVRSDERVGAAVGALMRVMDESNMSDSARENVYGHLFTEIDDLSIDVRVDENTTKENDDHERVKIHRDESGSKIEIRKEGTRTRIDKKDGKMRIDRRQNDAFMDNEINDDSRQENVSDTDTERVDTDTSDDSEHGNEEQEIKDAEQQPEVRGIKFDSGDDSHERKVEGDDD